MAGYRSLGPSDCMYLEHYGLQEPPFSITPDPRFVFLSERHRDALAHLLYGISQGGGGGFVQLTGEVGTGKTTLCRLLLEQLPPNTRVALLLNPRINPIELLEAVCEELRIPLQQDGRNLRGSSKTLVDALNVYLLQAYARGERVVLIIDEAQNLSVDALEQVRLLTNLETDTQKLLQIALLGQPELRDILARPELRQLAQRITARFHLTPLSAEETGHYLRHRFHVAGGRRFPFDAGALKRMFVRSGGVPRLLNVIAERALLAGYARDADPIDANLVDLAANEALPAHRPARAGAWRPWSRTERHDTAARQPTNEYREPARTTGSTPATRAAPPPLSPASGRIPPFAVPEVEQTRPAVGRARADRAPPPRPSMTNATAGGSGRASFTASIASTTPTPADVPEPMTPARPAAPKPTAASTPASAHRHTVGDPASTTHVWTGVDPDIPPPPDRPVAAGDGNPSFPTPTIRRWNSQTPPAPAAEIVPASAMATTHAAAPAATTNTPPSFAPRVRKRRRWPWLLAAALLPAASATWWWLAPARHSSSPEPPPAIDTSAAPGRRTQAPEADAFAVRLRQEPADPLPAWANLLALWGQPADAITINEDGSCSPAAPGLHCLNGKQGRLEHLLALGRPAVLALRQNDAPRWAVLLGANADEVRLALAGGLIDVRRASLQAAWQGDYFALWQTPNGVTGATLRPDARGPAVAWLRKRLGLPADAENRYDAAVAAAVRRFQSERGLPADGTAGAETLMALADPERGPRLLDMR